MTRIAINGFGRIGRNTLRALLERDSDLEVVAVNDLTAPATLAHLLAYDSSLGRLGRTVEVDGDTLVVDGRRIRVLAEREPADLPWGELGVDVVLESTGRFTSADAARAHLTAGAKRVLVSAPADGADVTLAFGVKLMPLPEEPFIRFAGRLSDQERLQALEAATVVVVPSPYESLSLLALESFAVGTPVLANARSEVLVDHCLKSNAGLYYADRDEFIECLKLLVADGSMDEAGAQGLRAVCRIMTFTRSEALEEAITVSVTAKPTYSTTPPTWITGPIEFDA